MNENNSINIVLPHHHSDDESFIIEQMPGEENVSIAASLFKLLNDPSRLKIFWLLCHCEECVINIASLTKMSSPAVSHHLRLLKSSGLIISERKGKEMYYKAAATPIVKSLHTTIESILEITCPE